MKDGSYGKFAFVYDECQRSKGLDINLIYKIVTGNSSGVNISGLFNGVDETSKGLNVAFANLIQRHYGVNVGFGNATIESYGLNIGGLNFHRNHSAGVDISLYAICLGNYKGINLSIGGQIQNSKSRGLNISGLVSILSDSNGVNIAGLTNVISPYKEKETASKGCNIAGLVNYVAKPKDFLIQYATFGNIVKEENPDAFILNIGLWNKIGNRHHPFVQVYGLKNITKLLRKNKRNQALEEH